MAATLHCESTGVLFGDLQNLCDVMCLTRLDATSWYQLPLLGIPEVVVADLAYEDRIREGGGDGGTLQNKLLVCKSIMEEICDLQQIYNVMQCCHLCPRGLLMTGRLLVSRAQSAGM